MTQKSMKSNWVQRAATALTVVAAAGCAQNQPKMPEKPIGDKKVPCTVVPEKTVDRVTIPANLDCPKNDM